MYHFFYYWINLCVCCLSSAAIAANTPIEHTAPPYWWANMQHPDLQVMLHGKNIAHYQVKLSSVDVQLKSVTTLDNPNYVFIDLDISQAKAQKFDFVFSQNGKKQFSHSYELKQRQTPAPQGLSPADVIYLLMPDRFANGNPKNDVVSTMQETWLQRDSLIARHGGDLQGIIDHLDYLDNLGITALWLNPVLTNDQPKWSYHGYAATDHYQIDPRFGDIELYRNLSQKAHQKGIKMVKDVIFNHVGDQHWFIKDLPSATWIHQFPKFTKTTYMTSTLMDPYASQHDKSVLLDGWFDKHMPDLNQHNQYV
ncbi:MAG TPA: alpha-amylase family glycosyl hydrolase, partial [Chitinophagales bacterium]|nr:alpha-amylase family glycosyl hydrolase [Chitinophagales bacterium]